MTVTATYEEMAYLVALVEAGVLVEAPHRVCGRQVTWQPLWLVTAFAVINEDRDLACWVTEVGDVILAQGGDDSSPIWECLPCGTGGGLDFLGADGLTVALRVRGWTMEGRSNR